MGLYQKWSDLCDQPRSQQEATLYWNTYFEVEKEAYIKILSEKETVVKGSISELADKFGMTKVQVAGFIDGINTSLEEEIDLDSLTEDSEVELKIIFEKLYENMLNAKAEWLYKLKEWDDILSAEERQDIKRNFDKSRMAVSTKVGRNDPCPCGSGKKYKKCCMLKQ